MKSISKELLDRAVLAMAAAIEIYNKPGLPYRNESFTILAINSWELLLKAKWLELHSHKRQSLYVYERRRTKSGVMGSREYIKRTRSKAPLTHEVAYLANRLTNKNVLASPASKNILLMLEFRDCATHFYNEAPAFETRLYEIGAACVKNFVNVVREWFGREITEFDLHLMPLALITLPSHVEGLLLNTEESNFLAFVENLDEPGADPESLYSISVNVELQFTRSKSKDALAVKTTGDPSALPVKLTEENIRERYPWDYKTLTEKCKQRYSDFKANSKYHHVRKKLETDVRFGHSRFLDPANTNSGKKVFFNPNIIEEFDKYYTKKGLST